MTVKKLKKVVADVADKFVMGAITDFTERMKVGIGLAVRLRFCDNDLVSVCKKMGAMREDGSVDASVLIVGLIGGVKSVGEFKHKIEETGGTIRITKTEVAEICGWLLDNVDEGDKLTAEEVAQDIRDFKEHIKTSETRKEE